MSRMKKDFKDKGWAWVIAAACFWTSLTATGIVPSSGVLYTLITDELHISKEAASWPFTLGNAFTGIGVSINCMLNGFVPVRRQAIAAAILCFLGIFTCYFIRNIVAFCVFFGVINGLGAGILFSGSLVIVCQYFQRYATVATGILFGGISVSCISYSPLMEHLSEHYGFNGALLIVSGTALNSLVGTLLYYDPPSESEVPDPSNFPRRSSFVKGSISLCSRSNVPVDVSGTLNFKAHLLNELKLWLQVFRYPMFVVITLGFECYNFCNISYLMIVADNAADVGVDKIKAALLVSTFAACELFGRLSSGWIVDLGWMKVRTLLVVMHTSLGVTYAVTPALKSHLTLALSSCVAGYLNGTIGINWTVTLNDYLGFKLLSPSIAVSGLIYILLSLSFPFLIGYIRDGGGSYNIVFYIFGVMQFIGAAGWLLEPMAFKIQQKGRLPEE